MFRHPFIKAYCIRKALMDAAHRKLLAHFRSAPMQAISKAVEHATGQVHDAARRVHGAAAHVYSASVHVHDRVIHVHGPVRHVRDRVIHVHDRAIHMHGPVMHVHDPMVHMHGRGIRVHGPVMAMFLRGRMLHGYGVGVHAHTDHLPMLRRMRRAAAASLRYHQHARAGAPPWRSVSPQGGGCKAAGTRLAGVSPMHVILLKAGRLRMTGARRSRAPRSPE
jgi:hypothetical protein